MPGAARRESRCGNRCALLAPARREPPCAAALTRPSRRTRSLLTATGENGAPRAARVPQPYLPRTAPTPSGRPSGAPPPRFYWSLGRPRAASAALSGAAPRPSAPPVTARPCSCHNRAGLRPRFLRSRLRSAPPSRAPRPPRGMAAPRRAGLRPVAAR